MRQRIAMQEQQRRPLAPMHKIYARPARIQIPRLETFERRYLPI
jgi:hypothetical protein